MLWLVGDDHYVATHNLRRLLREAQSVDPAAGAFGWPNCGGIGAACRHDRPPLSDEDLTSHTFCGGAGIALSRRTVERMVRGYGGAEGFLRGYNRSCSEPTPFTYSDLVLSCELRHFNVSLGQLPFSRTWPNPTTDDGIPTYGLSWGDGLVDDAARPGTLLEAATRRGVANIHRVDEAESHALRGAFAEFEAASRRGRGELDGVAELESVAAFEAFGAVRARVRARRAARAAREGRPSSGLGALEPVT